MKHIRCPICQTLFRVNADLLAKRGGRVRCGQCGNVFNALDGHELPLPKAPAASSSSGQERRLGGGESRSREREQIEDSGTASSEEDASAGGRTLLASEREPEPEGRREPTFTASEGRSEADEELQRATSIPDWVADRPDLAEAAPVAQKTRLPWVFFGVLLVSALLQALWLFRAELAMNIPALRPVLQEACQALGCVIPLPREASLLAIEASELHPVTAGQPQLKLGATLRNRASFAQDFPHMELSLTDLNDQVVARRVFAPSEYLDGKQGTQFQPGSDLPVSLVLDTGTLFPAGYRLYVFYP